MDVEFGGREEEEEEEEEESRDSQNLEESGSRPRKPLEVWTEAEILQWLNDSGLEYFADIFQGIWLVSN